MATPPPPPSVVLIAHRGDSAGAPENSMPAFDAALTQGFTSFETDCQLTADGVAVVLHDEALGRVNDGQAGRAVAHTMAAELAQLDAGAWFGAAFAGTRIPTLQQVLTEYKGRAHIHLELKSKQVALPGAVAQLLQTHGWATPPSQCTAAQHQRPQQAAGNTASAGLFAVPGLTITSFHLEQLQASKQLLPHVAHGWLIQEVTPDAIATAAACGFEMVCPRANALTAAGVQQLVAHGFAVRAWGVKTIELLHHVVACGVHGCTVNWPQRAADALRVTRTSDV